MGRILLFVLFFLASDNKLVPCNSYICENKVCKARPPYLCTLVPSCARERESGGKGRVRGVHPN